MTRIKRSLSLAALAAGLVSAYVSAAASARASQSQGAPAPGGAHAERAISATDLLAVHRKAERCPWRWRMDVTIFTEAELCARAGSP